jgi:carotenoid 1,2-hydratase
MTERGHASLDRGPRHVRIGPSAMAMRDGTLVIDFAEMALPWPGQGLFPKRVSGRVELTPEIASDRHVDLDHAGRHVWSPRMPKAVATVTCDALPGGGWRGRAYHDMNFGDRPIEQDFIGWDWARGNASADGDTIILYDAILRSGPPRRLGLRYSDQTSPEPVRLPDRQALPRGFWGVRTGVACDTRMQPRLLSRLEDSPFYTRSRIGTVLGGQPLEMVHETLDCRRLSHPLVRLMLPFRMPRRGRYP